MRFEDSMVSTACGAALLALILLADDNPETVACVPATATVEIRQEPKARCPQATGLRPGTGESLPLSRSELLSR